MAGLAGHNPFKRNLSKSILGMKFMSRSAPVDETADSYGRRDTQWVSAEGDNSAKHIKYDRSYMNFDGLCRVGRYTTKKFNPAVEKIIAAEHSKQESSDSTSEVEEMEGVSAAEMSERYKTLVNKNRKRSNSDVQEEESGTSAAKHKKKFLKPF